MLQNQNCKINFIKYQYSEIVIWPEKELLPLTVLFSSFVDLDMKFVSCGTLIAGFMYEVSVRCVSHLMFVIK